MRLYDAMLGITGPLTPEQERDLEIYFTAVSQMRHLPPLPIPLRIVCPECGTYHVDEGEFATKPHHTHACQQCGNVWRPAIVNTVGVRFLPGFKNGA